MEEALEFPPKYHSKEEQSISNIEDFKDLLNENTKFEAYVHLSSEHNSELAKLLGHWTKDEDITPMMSEITQDEVRHSPKISAEFGDLENAIEIKGDRRNGLYLELRGPGRGPETFKNINIKEIRENTFCLTPDEEALLNSFDTENIDSLAENGRGLYICAKLAKMGGYDLDFYREVVDGKDYHGYILRTKEEEKQAA